MRTVTGLGLDVNKHEVAWLVIFFGLIGKFWPRNRRFTFTGCLSNKVTDMIRASGKKVS